ncbi:MAG: amidinotransferase [Bacteroidetes bacterium GWE2_39_28]|nr:MAG: amidinotransferase [Bacteroidetes bacterium GWE2_39_28]OFY13504.1 MAG: amidinotransferase [Bacteroidetes bacterium GWF2_39_10]OFZ07187.1 MAG: amidinotransferase [Bacteroidetes bacterium RIFOXYB2_FULL_39_7]HCT94836.1 amidinotransferase [Rikenellaceae bacterium]
MQSTNKILMVRPSNFGFNSQTSANNAFQKEGFAEMANEKATAEFDNFTAMLKDADVEVMVINDTPEPHTPDSVFPNNWFSTHEGGTLVLYPMFAPNRRLERKEGVINFLKSNFKFKRVVDLTDFEKKEKFLEGTGSMILDRDNCIAFACRSQRTDEEVLEQFCDELEYDYLIFDACDSSGKPIYHTNVMMCVGSAIAIVCLDAVDDINQREDLIGLIEESDKTIIEISLEQMEEFAGNMLEVRGKEGQPLLVMSARAKRALTNEQVSKLEKYCKIIAPELETIENNGGGSARCMMAEIFV